jgi:hypothetical protein
MLKQDDCFIAVALQLQTSVSGLMICLEQASTSRKWMVDELNACAQTARPGVHYVLHAHDNVAAKYCTLMLLLYRRDAFYFRTN